jgi:hypothetical protein
LKDKLKRILPYAANALLLLLIGLCLLRIHGYSRLLLSQQSAEFWRGEEEASFAQVSCFFPADSLGNFESVFSFRRSIAGKLNDAGLEPRTEGEYWIDCYSAQDTLNVKGERGDTAEVTAIGVGGDFFFFHPYELVSGSYITDDDLMQDRVVLDYELAWRLFGGTELEGMSVEINGAPYYIAGVVHREADKFSNRAFTGEPVLFMSYTALTALKESTGISTYEIAMPDPITDFAETFVADSFKDAGGIVVENSTRYSFGRIFSFLKDFGDDRIADSGVRYPYWENAARISEAYIARLYAIIAVLALLPLVYFTILMVRLIRWLILRLKFGAFLARDAWDDRYARQDAWKERRVSRRAERNIKRHERERKKREKAAAPPPDEGAGTGEALAPDVERVVREIMAEMASTEQESKQ